MVHTTSTGFVIEGWHVSPDEGLLTRDNNVIHLEPKVMEVLCYFVSRPGQVVTREELERDVWHGAIIGYDAVTKTVIKLRKALDDDAKHPRYIATIPKKGYQLVASVTLPNASGQAALTEPARSTNANQRPPWAKAVWIALLLILESQQKTN